MTTATQINYVYAAPASHHSLWNLMVEYARKVKAHVEYTNAMRKLARLNDHHLTDIGLTREDVRGFSAGGQIETSCMKAIRQNRADLMSLSFPS